jgi:hypothetical protein
MFRVSDRDALDRCLAGVLPLFGPGVEVGECRPYWKVSELWECRLVSPASARSVAEQVLGCLLVAQGLASGWYVFGSLSADSADGFSGVFAVGQGTGSSKVVGVEWASFDLGADVGGEPSRAALGPRE